MVKMARSSKLQTRSRFDYLTVDRARKKLRLLCGMYGDLVIKTMK